MITNVDDLATMNIIWHSMGQPSHESTFDRVDHLLGRYIKRHHEGASFG